MYQIWKTGHKEGKPAKLTKNYVFFSRENMIRNEPKTNQTNCLELIFYTVTRWHIKRYINSQWHFRINLIINTLIRNDFMGYFFVGCLFCICVYVCVWLYGEWMCVCKVYACVCMSISVYVCLFLCVICWWV